MQSTVEKKESICIVYVLWKKNPVFFTGFVFSKFWVPVPKVKFQTFCYGVKKKVKFKMPIIKIEILIRIAFVSDMAWNACFGSLAMV